MMPVTQSVPATAAPAWTAKPRSPRPFVSCVMPAYNEAANLPVVIPDTVARLRELSEHWELIVVDDGSRDGTPAVMAAWLKEPGVRYLRLSRNFGKEAALTAGIDHAGGDVVFLMDADGQHPSTLMPQMMQSWLAGADMVCAARASRADESWLKRAGTALFYWLVNNGSRSPIPVDAGDFRLMDRRVVDALRTLSERNRFMKGLYAWVGFETVIVPYEPLARMAGHSTFSLRSLARLAFTGVTAFTNFPLRVVSTMGMLVALCAMVFGTWIVIEHFVRGHDVPGWATLVVGMMFFSGAQLLSIGILGEYVGRIFDEVKQRPVYLVADLAGRGALAPTAAVAAPPASDGASPPDADSARPGLVQ